MNKKEENSNTLLQPSLDIAGVIGGALVELDVNNTFWAEALATIDKNKLIELCENFKIPTKGKDRYRLASNLSKKIDLNKRMKIIVGFE
jgi:hypothetical protein